MAICTLVVMEIFTGVLCSSCALRIGFYTLENLQCVTAKLRVLQITLQDAILALVEFRFAYIVLVFLFLNLRKLGLIFAHIRRIGFASVTILPSLSACCKETSRFFSIVSFFFCIELLVEWNKKSRLSGVSLFVALSLRLASLLVTPAVWVLFCLRACNLVHFCFQVWFLFFTEK